MTPWARTISTWSAIPIIHNGTAVLFGDGDQVTVAAQGEAGPLPADLRQAHQENPLPGTARS